jgi:hypothetical protein
MANRLKSRAGRAASGLPKQSVEPVFGMISSGVPSKRPGAFMPAPSPRDQALTRIGVGAMRWGLNRTTCCYEPFIRDGPAAQALTSPSKKITVTPCPH